MRSQLMLLCLLTGLAFGKVKIVTSTADLAAIAREIGGNAVAVESIARGNQDPHAIEVLPSYMLKVKRADIYLRVGMELDMWADQIIGGSRNSRLIIVDCSEKITALEVPTGKVDASQGDIHSKGNPHYWLDPLNGILIAQSVAAALEKNDPANRGLYTANLEAFTDKVTTRMVEWEANYSSLRGQEVIWYHNTWPYLSYRFGLEAVDFVEPKPGIMPTPRHVEDLIMLIESTGIKVLGMEPYFSDKAPVYLQNRTGIKVVKMAPSVGAQPKTDTYLAMIEYNLSALKKALEL